jgi:hypothetical protein
MSNFGLWRNIVAMLIPQKEGAKTKAVFASDSGRVIYEEYNHSEKKPSEKSRFFVVSQADINISDSPKGGKIIQLSVDLANESHCKELKE